MEVYTSTLGCCSGRNFGRNSVEIRSKVGKAQKETKKNNTQLGVCTSLADSYSSPQATTDHENRGSLLMGCVWASGAPDSSRRQPETTREMLSSTRSCEAGSSAKITKNSVCDKNNSTNISIELEKGQIHSGITLTVFAMSESPKFHQITKKFKSRIEKRKDRLASRSTA